LPLADPFCSHFVEQPMNLVQCELETHYEDGGSSSAELDLDPDEIEQKIDWLSAAWSGTLSLVIGSTTLMVSTSEGRAAILAITGPDSFFDYSLGADIEGSTRFVHGGQPAEHPTRHCLGIDTAKRVVSAFIVRGGMDEMDPHWERQRAT
jgi:hypothetical protein